MIFDQDSIPGLSNPRVLEVPFWLGNADEPDLYSWEIPPTLDGIELYIITLLGSGVGAATSWIQYSAASADVYGTAVSYADPGVSIYTPAINGADNTTGSSVATDTGISITDSSVFVSGDYVKIGSGTANVETVQIVAIPDGTHLTVATTNKPHNPGETVFSCGRKFWIKVTIPTNAVGGVATSLYNIGIGKIYGIKSRL